MSAVPSTYPEDAPVIDLHKDGQSGAHPAFARHVVREVGPGAGKQMIRGHTRAGHTVPPYFRAKPQLDPGHYAPPTNPSEATTLPGGKAS